MESYSSLGPPRVAPELVEFVGERGLMMTGGSVSGGLGTVE